MVHRDLQSVYVGQGLSNQLRVIRKDISEIATQFQKLKKFIKSKDRKHPSTFVVFSADDSNHNNKNHNSNDKTDAVTKVTKGMYELFLEPTSTSSLSHFLQNKVCDLYLICESCNQIQGNTNLVSNIIIIITNMLLLSCVYIYS